MNHEQQIEEIEALESIFGDEFVLVSNEKGSVQVKILLKPFEEEENEDLPDLCLSVKFSFPEEYPEVSPICFFEEDNTSISLFPIIEYMKNDLIQKVEEESENFLGMPMVFSLIEVLKEELLSEKEKILKEFEKMKSSKNTDGSMYSQMMLKQKEKEEKAKKETERIQIKQKEEEEKRKTFETHTPVTKESFRAWRENFYLETNQLKEEESKGQTGKQFFLERKEEGVKDVELGEKHLQEIDFEKLAQDENEIDETLFLEEDMEDLDLSD